MSKSNQRKTALPIIDELRLLVGRAIIRYGLNTRDGQNHISVEAASNELFDQYSLKVFLCWLAHRHQFPVCTDTIQTANNGHLLTFDQTKSLANKYPFYSYFGADFEQSLMLSAFAHLDKRLSPDIDLAGVLYMETLLSSVAANENGKLYIKKKFRGRRGGEFYTPETLAQRCIEEPLNEDLLHLTNDLKRNSGFCKSRYSLVDPASGCGSFLLAALELMRKRLAIESLPASLVLDFARDCLYGCDIDMKAISISRSLILIALAAEFRQLSAQQDIDFDEYLSGFVEDLSHHIYCADPISALPKPQNGKDGFDFVVTNPPYISFGARNQPALPKQLASYLRNTFPASAEYKIRIHSIFQELCVRAVRTGGQVVLLVPDAFLNGAYYSRLRQLILDQCEIVALTELPESTFGDATAGRWCTAHYKKVDRLTPMENSEYKVRLQRLTDTHSEKFELPVARLVSRDKSRFQLVFNSVDSDLLHNLAKLETVRSQYRGHTGIRSRLGQAALIADTPKDKGNWRRGITSGANVQPHQVFWSGKWLDITPAKLYAGGFSESVISGPKLLVRQTADRLVGGVDCEGLYHLNNVHAFTPISSQEVHSKLSCRLKSVQYLEGLLNSTLWLYLYQLKSRESKRALAQIDIEMVECLPLPPLNSELEQAIVTIIDSLAKVPEDSLEEFKRVLDRLVFDSYNLSPSEIVHIEKITCPALNKSSRAPLPTSTEAFKLVKSCLQPTV